MKHLHRILDLGVFVALTIGMSGCFFGEINNAAKEIEEVMDGKVFQIPTAKLVYNDGTIFAFAENGKKQRIEKGTDVWLYLDKTYYSFNTEKKTGTKHTFTSEYTYNTAYCFLEETWKLANYDETITKSTETIAGKKCTVYTDSDDNSKNGGWERISFVMNDIKATSFTTDVASDAFTAPASPEYNITDMTDSN